MTTHEKPLTDYLRVLDKGRVNDEAGQQLRRVVEAVMRTGLKGRLSLNFEIESADDGEHVMIAVKMSSKAPAAETQSTMFLALGGGDVEPVQQVLNLGGDEPPPGKAPRH